MESTKNAIAWHNPSEFLPENDKPVLAALSASENVAFRVLRLRGLADWYFEGDRVDAPTLWRYLPPIQGFAKAGKARAISNSRSEPAHLYSLR